MSSASMVETRAVPGWFEPSMSSWACSFFWLESQKNETAS